MILARDPALWFLVGVLGVWRVTHLVTAEDGPWGAVARLRALAGHGVVGQLLDCFLCLSVWTAVPWALVLAQGAVERVMVWLALSGGAILLERATAPAAPFMEGPAVETEDGDDVLR
ncbi:MAG: DUF1360 domain-containing protein [Vicinamibacterales bacterium]